MSNYSQQGGRPRVWKLWVRKGRRTLAQTTTGISWAEEQVSSREDRSEESILDDISTSSKSILHIVTDTHCASQLTHVFSFSSFR